MTWKKFIQRIVLPLLIVLITVVVVAQIINGKNLFSELFSGNKAKDEPLTAENGDNRKVTGDDPWVELEKIYQVFNDGRNISYSGKLKLQEEDDDKIMEEAPYSCEVDGGNFHYIIDSVEMIYNKEISLNIYHREKIMILGRGKQNVKNWWSFSSIDTIKKYALLDSAEVKVMQEGAFKLISVENTGSPDVYAYEIYYNPATHRLSKLVMFFASLQDISDESDSTEDEMKNADPQIESGKDDTNNNAIYFNTYRMELSYDNFSVREGQKNFAPESKYIRFNKKKVMINDEYKGYRIIVPDTEEKN